MCKLHAQRFLSISGLSSFEGGVFGIGGHAAVPHGKAQALRTAVCHDGPQSPLHRDSGAFVEVLEALPPLTGADPQQVQARWRSLVLWADCFGTEWPFVVPMSPTHRCTSTSKIAQVARKYRSTALFFLHPIRLLTKRRSVHPSFENSEPPKLQMNMFRYVCPTHTFDRIEWSVEPQTTRMSTIWVSLPWRCSAVEHCCVISRSELA